MGILEDVVVNAKTAATVVGKKASELVDISKLRIQASELNVEISKRYEALGRIVYDSKKEENEVEGLVLECIKSVDALYERLDETNEKIAKLSKKAVCKQCGYNNSTDAIFCARCGVKI
ncbi:MAG: zinc ribbon domain-containing protein [Oscillospiraceae bacterium]|jgi:ribosomal protein L40E|nr:zinc ribbon domain-containing protein [Oscillospiraceae bacterium]